MRCQVPARGSCSVREGEQGADADSKAERPRPKEKEQSKSGDGIQGQPDTEQRGKSTVKPGQGKILERSGRAIPCCSVRDHGYHLSLNAAPEL